jgi:hypothetical protein
VIRRMLVMIVCGWSSVLKHTHSPENIVEIPECWDLVRSSAKKGRACEQTPQLGRQIKMKIGNLVEAERSPHIAIPGVDDDRRQRSRTEKDTRIRRCAPTFWRQWGMVIAGVGPTWQMRCFSGLINSLSGSWRSGRCIGSRGNDQ